MEVLDLLVKEIDLLHYPLEPTLVKLGLGPPAEFITDIVVVITHREPLVGEELLTGALHNDINSALIDLAGRIQVRIDARIERFKGLRVCFRFLDHGKVILPVFSGIVRPVRYP